QDDFTLFLSNQNAPYVIKEAAILFETGGNEQCDAVVLVTAPESVRIARVMERDHTDSSSVKKRVAHQWSDEDKIPMADYVINNIDWDETLKKIDEIHIDLLHKH
ncbi:MAG: dephospho-CoA kinase, partial [Flavobacteriaceae bacterium]